MQFLIRLFDIRASVMSVHLPICILQVFIPIICALWPSAVITLFLNGLKGPYVLSLKFMMLLFTIVLLHPVSAE
jgi:hypothetical protein